MTRKTVAVFSNIYTDISDVTSEGGFDDICCIRQIVARNCPYILDCAFIGLKDVLPIDIKIVLSLAL